MALLDPNASDIDNIQRASFLYGRAETSVAIAEQLIARRTIEYGKHTDDEVKRAMRICDMIATIKFFEKVVKAFKSLIDSINEVFTWLADKIDYIVVPYLLKKYQIILLKIKQLVTTVKLKAAKAMQAVVNRCRICYCCSAVSTAASSYAYIPRPCSYRWCSFARCSSNIKSNTWYSLCCCRKDMSIYDTKKSEED